MANVMSEAIGKFYVQAIISIGLLGVSAYLWVSSGTVPDALLALTTAVTGFWFGAATQSKGNSGG